MPGPCQGDDLGVPALPSNKYRRRSCPAAAPAPSGSPADRTPTREHSSHLQGACATTVVVRHKNKLFQHHFSGLSRNRAFARQERTLSGTELTAPSVCSAAGTVSSGCLSCLVLTTNWWRHFTDSEVGAQRNHVTCLRSQGSVTAAAAVSAASPEAASWLPAQGDPQTRDRGTQRPWSHCSFRD